MQWMGPLKVHCALEWKHTDSRTSSCIRRNALRASAGEERRSAVRRIGWCSMTQRGKTWRPTVQPSTKLKMPEMVKANVEARANDLINTALKPTHVRPASGDERFNSTVDIYSKWHGSSFYFCAKYACPGPHALTPFFESRFARLQYAGNERFNLSYMRHTGKWWEIYPEVSLDEVLKAIEDDPHFLP